MSEQEIIGHIHSIETLGTLDGPGTRCVVFMQGCPLRCAYCHNPDTWKFGSKNKMSAANLVKKISRYKNYFSKKGGITVSGGEPLAQAKFVKEVFRLCKQEKIHTALDTAGSIVNKETIDLLDYTDLVLLDIKHTDREEYKKLTGADIETTMEFLNIIDEKQIPFWLRQVIVPEINDSPKQMQKLADILQSKSSLEHIELLAYHDMARQKWQQLGLDYPLKDTHPPTKESLEKLRNILKEHNLPISFPE